MNGDDGKGYQASSDSKTTLVNIASDIQIIICTLLHPSDILALRQTCKNFQLPTRQRVVWVAALRRVCVDNSLFLPSFPITDMSDVELEHASIAPHRWIKLCTAFEQQHPNNSIATLGRRTTRIVKKLLATENEPEYFIVPGGRYMLSWSCDGIFLWDLGYTSSADCKLIASVGLEDGSHSCMVQATPDGMGLIILSYGNSASFYEVYPQSETPQLAHIAQLSLDSLWYFEVSLLSDRVVLYHHSNVNSIVFRVWDYRKNYSISFSGDVDFSKLYRYLKVIATEKEIFLLCHGEIFVWAIPALLPQPLKFLDHNPAHIPALFRIAYPDDIVRDDIARNVEFQTMLHWYYGPSQRLYFHIFCQKGSKLHRFEIIIKPDLFDTSLHLIDTQLVPDDFCIFEKPRICEGTLVTHWQIDDLAHRVYTGFTTVNSHAGPAVKMLLPGSGYPFYLCAASGRYVHFDKDTRGIVLVDFF